MHVCLYDVLSFASLLVWLQRTLPHIARTDMMSDTSSSEWLGASTMSEHLIAAALELQDDHFPPAEPDAPEQQSREQGQERFAAGSGESCVESAAGTTTWVVLTVSAPL